MNINESWLPSDVRICEVIQRDSVLWSFQNMPSYFYHLPWKFMKPSPGKRLYLRIRKHSSNAKTKHVLTISTDAKSCQIAVNMFSKLSSCTIMYIWPAKIDSNVWLVSSLLSSHFLKLGLTLFEGLAHSCAPTIIPAFEGLFFQAVPHLARLTLFALKLNVFLVESKRKGGFKSQLCLLSVPENFSGFHELISAQDLQCFWVWRC